MTREELERILDQALQDVTERTAGGDDLRGVQPVHSPHDDVHGHQVGLHRGVLLDGLFDGAGPRPAFSRPPEKAAAQTLVFQQNPRYNEITSPTGLPTIIRQCLTSSSTLRWLLPSMTKRDPDARIVMISSLAYGDTFDRAKAIGAKGFVEKPFHQEQLVRVFEEALSQPGGALQ